jgi:hypothetical protein
MRSFLFVFFGFIALGSGAVAYDVGQILGGYMVSNALSSAAFGASPPGSAISALTSTVPGSPAIALSSNPGVVGTTMGIPGNNPAFKGWYSLGAQLVPGVLVNTANVPITVITTSGILPTPPNNLWMHVADTASGPKAVQIRFTAPFTGSVTLTNVVFTRAHPGLIINFFLVKNGLILASSPPPATGQGTTWNPTSVIGPVIAVNAGDTIDFMVQTPDFGSSSTNAVIQFDYDFFFGSE